MVKHVIVILMLLILVVGCAPSGNMAPSQPQIPVAVDNKSTEVPPIAVQPGDNKSTRLTPSTTIPASQLPVANVPSFIAETYTNDALGFTWQYPKKWNVIAKPYGDKVIEVVESEKIGANSGGVIVVPEAADFSKTVKAALEAFPRLAGFHAKIDASPSNAITLADGKTFASESIATTNIGGMDIYIYTVGFNQGGKTIIAYGMTLGGGNDKAIIKEIAQTLAVK